MAKKAPLHKLVKTLARVADSVYDRVFGCHHNRISFPLTVDKQTTVSCLDCGTRFLYDWKNMRMRDKLEEKVA